MLAIEGLDGLVTGTGQMVGARYRVRWVRIDTPDSDADSLPSGFVLNQGLAQGGAKFARLEGCWYGDQSVFFNPTSGGDAGAGQVWQYIPAREELVLVFESPGAEAGKAFDLVRNNMNNSEWAGACFSPEGRTLFVNIQGDTRPLRTLAGGGAPTKGMTFAIWGPWESGPL